MLLLFGSTRRPGAPSANVPPGQTAQFNLQLNVAAGFTGTVQLHCTGAPQSATCIVPSSLQATGGSSVGFTAMVTTAVNGVVVAAPDHSPRWPSYKEWQALAILALLSMSLIASCRSRRLSREGRLSFAAVIFVALLIAGCGGGSGGSNATNSNANSVATTPPGTYMLTVTASSGGVTEQTILNLTVQ